MRQASRDLSLTPMIPRLVGDVQDISLEERDSRSIAFQRLDDYLADAS